MKTGRNAPCPCSSGKKFKQCCYEKDGNALPPFTPPEIPSEMIFQKDPVKNSKITISTKPDGDYQDCCHVTIDMSEYFDEPPETQYLQHLVSKGLIKAKKTVRINQKVADDLLRNTPILDLMRSILTALSNNSGKAGITDMYTLESINIDKDIMELMPERSLKPLLQLDSDSSPFYVHVIGFAKSLLGDLGFVKVKNEELVITPKGLEFINGKYINQAYFLSLKLLHEEFDWFYLKPDVPEPYKTVRELTGLFYYLIHLSGEKDVFEPVMIFEEADSFLDFKNTFREQEIDLKGFRYAAIDKIFGLYGLLMGLFSPVLAENGEKSMFIEYRLRINPLFKKIFNWLL